MPATFHFLRPEWLLALLPAAGLAAVLWWRLRRGRTDWARVVDPHLLVHLSASGGPKAGRWPALVLLAGWTAAVLAMAGPAWEKLPQPAGGRLDPVVVALSLAPSMAASDASPSRLAAARYKVADVLARMRGGEVGLVVFADIPFTAAPLTEDGRVIGQMLPDLSTDLMRGDADRPDAAIAMAVDLLKGTGATRGRILLLADGPGEDPARAAAAAKAAAAAGFRVNVIGVGGAGADGARALDAAGLVALASAGHGAYSQLTADDRDLERTLPLTNSAAAEPPVDQSGFRADVWADAGPFVLLLAVLLAPLAFRGGWIAVLLLAAAPALLAPRPAGAGTWADLWQRPDQQGASAFARGDYAGAAQRFEDPAWRGSALYAAGDYAGAAAAYAGVPGADYNRGNALARADRLEEALDAYDAALVADPSNDDARLNRELVKGILEARKKQEEERKKKQGGGGGGGGSGGGGPQNAGGKGDAGKGDAGKGDAGKGGDTAPDKGGNASGKDAPGKDAPGKPADAGKSDPQTAGGGAPQPSAPPPGPAPLPPRRPPELAAAQPPQSQPPQTPQPQAPQPQAPPPQAPPAQAQQPPQAPSPQDRAAGPGVAPPPLPDGLPGSPREKGDADSAFAPPPSDPTRTASPPPSPARPVAPPGAEGKTPAQSVADDPQSREQALRQVPDDPGGLLRARIRAHYSGRPVSVSEEGGP